MLHFHQFQLKIHREVVLTIDFIKWFVVAYSLVAEVDNLQGIYPLEDEWVFGCSLKTRLADQTKNSTTEVFMVKRLNELNNLPEIG